MPLFAVLLKIVYIFKRRLYMEHLMVALHSHAFIFMSLLLLAIHAAAAAGRDAVAPGVDWLLSLLRDAVWIWLPIYLFLMQKRVYRQGWIMTTIKYSFVGICYLLMLGFGLAGPRRQLGHHMNASRWRPVGRTQGNPAARRGTRPSAPVKRLCTAAIASARSPARLRHFCRSHTKVRHDMFCK